ncbi:MAG TPA: hypothetical protein VKZ63_22585, partial [Kofleriaceae bacterium]|nr:hypothetical protein [Kofleriaceae bacterium]
MTRQRRGARSGAARRGQGERGGATVAVLALVAVGLLVIAGARHLGGRVSERYRCQGDAVRALGDGAGPCQEVAAVAFAPPAAPDGDGAGGPASAGPGDPAASGGADVATPGAAGDTPPVPGTADGQGGPSPLEGCTDEAACEYQFTGEVADGEYYWPIGYDVTVTDDEVIVTIGVELVPDWDVSPDQLEDAQRIAEEG